MFWFCDSCVINCLKKVRISVFSIDFFQCLLSCENDWSVAVILPNKGTNGIGLLDKSIQKGCILSLDRIVEGLRRRCHIICCWLCGGFCSGCCLQWIRRCYDHLACESATKENAKHVPCTVCSLTVVFVKFFPLIEVRSILEKNTFFSPLY